MAYTCISGVKLAVLADGLSDNGIVGQEVLSGRKQNLRTRSSTVTVFDLLRATALKVSLACMAARAFLSPTPSDEQFEADRSDEAHSMAVLNLSRDEDRTPLLRDSARAPEAAVDDQSLEGNCEDEKSEALYKSPPRFWAVVLSYIVILFLFACNGTVITTTYGAIAESLHAYSTAATWLNASYMVR